MTILVVAPGNVAIHAVYTSSISISWNTVLPSSGYEVDASTDQNFGVFKSTITTNGSAITLVVDSMTSLSPNTTYYIRAGNLYNGTTTYASLPLSTSTRTSPITNAQIYQVYATSITVNWTPLGSAAGYELDASTDNFVTWVSSISMGGVQPSTLTVSNIWPAVTYSLRVGGVNWNGVVNYSNLGSTNTAGVVPSNPQFQTVYASSITVSWSSASPSGGYEVDASTDSGFGAFTSSITANAGSTSLTVDSMTSLSPNTTYYIRVGNLYNGTTAYNMAIISTSTLANVPGVPSFSNVWVSSLTVSWSGSAGSVYEMDYSTDVNFAASASTVTANAGSPDTITGLQANTTCYVRVRAQNWNGINTDYVTASTSTLAVVPGIPQLDTVYASNIAAHWDPSGDHLGTRFTLAASLSSSMSPVFSSSATSGGSAATVANLIPNTTYYLAVKATNNNGIDTAYSSPSVSTITLASIPALAAQSYVSITSGSLVAQWDANSNPSGTEYFVQLSTDSLNWSQNSGWNSGTAAPFNGLAFFTVYYAEVKARNSDLTETGWLNLGAVRTSPSMVGSPIVEAVYVSSITAGWNPPPQQSDGRSQDGFTLSVTADGVNSIYISSPDTISDPHALVSLTVSPLQPNTTYQVTVGAYVNEGGYTVTTSTTFASRATLAANPGPSSASVSPNSDISLTVNWSSGTAPNFNPAYTLYQVQISTDPDVDSSGNFLNVNGSSITSSLNVNFPDLNPDATYYAQVQSFNTGYGTYNSFVNLGSTITLTPIPGGMQSLAHTTWAVFNWSTVTCHGYSVLVSTQPDCSNPSIFSIPDSSTSSYKVTGLLPSQMYCYEVGSLNSAGAPNYTGGAFTTRSATSQLAVSRVNVGALATGGEGEGVGVPLNTTVNITFNEDVDPSTIGGIALYAIKDNMANYVASGGSYNNLLAGAITISAANITYDSTQQTVTLTPGVQLQAGYLYAVVVPTTVNDYNGGSFPAQWVYYFQTMADFRQHNVFATHFSNKIYLDVPAGAFTTNYYLRTNITPSVAGIEYANLPQMIKDANTKLGQEEGTMLADYAVEIVAYNYNGSLINVSNGNVQVGIAVPPSSTNVSMYTLDTTDSLWVKVLTSSVNSSAGRVESSVPHFSVYALVQQASESLSDAHPYPVPFVPSRGHTAITFTNLANQTTIRIFTISGEEVRRVDVPQGSANYVWDVKNKAGENVVSGVYLYLITSPSDKKTGKLMIIR
jgi:hypothetical protein